MKINMKTSPYEQILNLRNEFVKENSPSRCFNRDIRDGESQSNDLFIRGTSQELVKYVNENYFPPSENKSEWKEGDKYLICPIDEEYFKDILKESPTATGFIFFLNKKDGQIELKSNPVYVLQPVAA